MKSHSVFSFTPVPLPAAGPANNCTLSSKLRLSAVRLPSTVFVLTVCILAACIILYPEVAIVGFLKQVRLVCLCNGAPVILNCSLLLIPCFPCHPHGCLLNVHWRRNHHLVFYQQCPKMCRCEGWRGGAVVHVQIQKAFDCSFDQLWRTRWFRRTQATG